MPPFETFEIKTADSSSTATFGEIADEIAAIRDRVVKAGGVVLDFYINDFTLNQTAEQRKLSAVIHAEMPEPPTDHFDNPLLPETSVE